MGQIAQNRCYRQQGFLAQMFNRSTKEKKEKMRSEGKIELYNGDCLEIMKQIENKSIDAIICDLPYGSTQCKWDTIIPFDKLWGQYNRIIKTNGAIVLQFIKGFKH